MNFKTSWEGLNLPSHFKILIEVPSYGTLRTKNFNSHPGIKTKIHPKIIFHTFETCSNNNKFWFLYTKNFSNVSSAWNFQNPTEYSAGILEEKDDKKTFYRIIYGDRFIHINFYSKFYKVLTKDSVTGEYIKSILCRTLQ